MKKITLMSLVFVLVTVSLISIIGCTQQSPQSENNAAKAAVEKQMKIQCSDGSVADDASKCPGIEEKKESRADEGDSSVLAQISEECRKYSWPPDCSFIMDQVGREICKKCTGQKTQPSTSLPVQPRINLTFVKGMYMSSLLAGRGQSIDDPVRLRADGANTIAFTIEYKADAEGRQIKYSDGIDEQVISTIRKYKNEEFAVFVIPTLRYMPRGIDEPLGIPESLQNDPAFFGEFNEFVLHIAGIAEKENVEYFAPMDEPDYRLGPWRAINWSQEILPEVRKRFSGKVIYKGGFSPPFDISWANLSGYDIAGTTIVVLDEYNEDSYRKMAQKQISDLKAVAKRDSVKEVWVSGFGPVETIRNPINEMQKSDIYRIVFEEAENITGLVPWENPNNLLKDTAAENEVKVWFTEKMK